MIEALWCFSLPIAWVFIIRRGSRKAAEECRQQTEERIGGLKALRRDNPSADPRL